MPNNYLPRYKIENSTLLANAVIHRFVSRHHLTQVASSLTKYKLQVIFFLLICLRKVHPEFETVIFENCILSKCNLQQLQSLPKNNNSGGIVLTCSGHFTALCCTKFLCDVRSANLPIFPIITAFKLYVLPLA